MSDNSSHVEPESFALFSCTQVIYENGCERVHNLKSAMKMESVSHDLIDELFSSNDSQTEMLNDLSQQFDTSDHGNVCNTTLSKDENDEMTDKPNNTKSHFVEIGEFRCGSIFGLGERMDDRVVVAKHTEVQCLLIPHYWLFQKKQNAGNIWQR